MPLILFWLGLVGGGIIFLISLFNHEDIKRGLGITPIMLLIAAAVAKYLGL